MKFEKSLFLQVRANAHNPEKVDAPFHLPKYETVRDSEGLVSKKRTSLTLIERLLVKAGVQAAPPPMASKPRRGRPVGSKKVPT